MSNRTQDAIRKWNRAAKSLDLGNRGEHLRYGPFKRELFGKAEGRTLLVAAGTGLDFKYLPAHIEVTAIDFSPVMLSYAERRMGESAAPLELVQADVTELEFEDESFDTVLTSCTFCSVPDAVKGLKQLRRVLRGPGRLLMFEHVRPRLPYLGLMMDLMNPLVRLIGPEINRRTADNVRAAGFRLTREYNVFLDMVKLFEAEKG
ncbi:MAG: class I SAM-dependent methyltransferase [Gemmatimonadota bacterium]|nr:class I SAM-dependent methyltransferase [Gemmatimonadota bacterium]MDH3424514.1 class I SAM-dependent methyltransferase [Gemmatimonadota bacterium]